MKRLFKAYKDLIKIIYNEAPVMVIFSLFCTLVSGLLSPLRVYLSQNVYDGGLAVARGEMRFSDYIVFLILFAVVSILPALMSGYIFSYVEPFIYP